MTDQSRANLHEVSKSLGGPSRRGKDILDPGELQHLLGDSSGHDPGSSWSRHHTHRDGPTFPRHLTRHRMGLPDLVPPVTPPHRDHRQLGQYNCATNRGGDLLAALNAESDVAVAVTNDNECLESGSLPGTGLLLDRHNLHDVVLEAGAELVDDLVLLDGEGMEVDLLKGLDLIRLHEAAEFRHRHPFLLLVTSGTATTTTAAVSPTTTAKSSAKATAFSSSLSHDWLWE
ncbi:hypothetical protein F2P56_006062 [Juglans regia]|uniref:Uncharacterized protein n=1 Tax=Juglans regia TaxID=51240 RepID=A0A833XYT7_JUGRE|nr:hypothetical protein F2P56_006062 [Juglans regia]